MSLRIVLFLITFCSSLPGLSQHLFPEKFQGCVTDQFALESDSLTVTVPDETLIAVLLQSMDEKTKAKILGTLTLQIIVDFDGNSCLISFKNDTNVKTKNLHLKQKIDSELKWNKPSTKVAALVAVKFEATGLRIARLGVNAKRGLHKISG
jgi:hypothetical protein